MATIHHKELKAQSEVPTAAVKHFLAVGWEEGELGESKARTSRTTKKDEKEEGVAETP